MWGVVFLLTAVSGLIAVETRTAHDFFEWILPIILLVGAFKLQGWLIAEAQVRSRRRPAARTG
jgi:hypothetical protein